MAEWNFIAIHGLVLLYIYQKPHCTTREIALALNVTERTIRRVIDDLREEEYITWQRQGRSNFYKIDSAQRLRHRLTRAVAVGELMKLLTS